VIERCFSNSHSARYFSGTVCFVTAGVGRLQVGEWVALAGALFWSAALLVIAIGVPIYVGETETSKATSSAVVVTHESFTLVDENGSGILLVIGVPLLVTIIVGIALWLRGARHGSGPIVWAFFGLLAAFNFLAMLTIGALIIPVTACLAVACTIRQTRPYPEVGGSALPI
jgi:hypothetical protein